MKKTTLLLASMMLPLGMMAQTIATFEEGSATIGSISGSELEGNQTEFVTGAENPVKDGLNTTEKCLYILTNQVIDSDPTIARPAWDSNAFYITFDEPVNITEDNRYLHIMHMKERVLNNWLVWAENGDGNYVEIARGTAPGEMVWFDIVADLKSKLDVVKSIRVNLDGNWGAIPDRYFEPTKFYYDEIVMNDQKFGRVANVITDNNILDFEDETVTNARVKYTPQSPNYINSVTWANTAGGINDSFTCAYFTGNTVTPAWWHGFFFEFKSPVDASDNKYLHVMMRKSVFETTNAQISLTDMGGNQSTALMNTPLTTEWVDYVLEIPESHTVFNGMYVKFNAQTPATECFVDEIFMDNNPDPRTSTSSVCKIENDRLNIAVVDGVVSVADYEGALTIYNTLGQCVYQGVSPSVVLAKGLYIVKAGNNNQKVFVK